MKNYIMIQNKINEIIDKIKELEREDDRLIRYTNKRLSFYNRAYEMYLQMLRLAETVDKMVKDSQTIDEEIKQQDVLKKEGNTFITLEAEGETLVNVCEQEEPVAITKSYTVNNSGNHIALQGEYDGKCRPVITGNTMVNLVQNAMGSAQHMTASFTNNEHTLTFGELTYPSYRMPLNYALDTSKTYTVIFSAKSSIEGKEFKVGGCSDSGSNAWNVTSGVRYTLSTSYQYYKILLTYRPEDITHLGFGFYTNTGGQWQGETVSIKDIMVFEGDLTQTPGLIPTEYVDGLKSSFEDQHLKMENLLVTPPYELISNVRILYSLSNVDSNLYTVYNGTNKNIYFDISNKETNEYSTTHQINAESISKVTLNDNQKARFINAHTNEGWECTDDDIEYINDNLVVLEGDWTHLTKEDFRHLGKYKVEYKVTGENKENTKTFYLNSPLLEGDTIEDVNGKATHVKRYEKVVLNGSENWAARGDVATTDQLIFLISNYVSNTNVATDCHLFTDFGVQTSSATIGAIEGVRLVNINQYGWNVSIKLNRLNNPNASGFKEWLQANPITVVYQLKSPIYETISEESILCDSYVNGHLDFDSVVPIEKVAFTKMDSIILTYINPNTTYSVQFESDNEGFINNLYTGRTDVTTGLNVTKGLNKFTLTTSGDYNKYFYITGIGFNASNIVVTEVGADFKYFKGLESSCEDNKLDIKITGKNLFDKDTSYKKNNTGIFNVNETGFNFIRENSNAYDYVMFDIKIPIGNYTLNYLDSSQKVTYWEFIDTNGDTMHTQRNRGSFELNNNCYKIKFYGEGIGEIHSITNLQIEEGTVATEYEPYKELIQTIQLSSPLLKGDRIEVIDEKMYHYHKMNKVVLNGSENWRRDNYEFGYIIGNTKKDNIIFSDNFPSKDTQYSVNPQNTFAIKSGGPAYGILIRHDACANINEFKQWLQANPTTVVYELAEPWYEEIQMPLYIKGVGKHIELDTGNINLSNINIKY